MLTNEKASCIISHVVERQHDRQVGVYDDEGPPVPIPNTVVKLIRAENTWRAAAWEDRSTPTLTTTDVVVFFCPFVTINNFLLL